MNKRLNSSLSGRLVPIFANNKKKRLKQALYANPSTDDFDNTSTNPACDEFSHSGSEYFEGGLQKPSLPPNKRTTSLTNEGWYNSAVPQQYSANSSTHQRSQAVNGRGELQSHMPAQQEYQLPPPRANSKLNLKVNGPRPSHYDAGRSTVIRNPMIKTEQDNTGENRRGGGALSSETFEKDQNQPIKERSTKQVNLMATPMEKTLRVITATIQNIVDWKTFDDKIAVIYEIFGTLDSQVSLNSTGNAKNFVIKDKTGTLRCTFWEMDRQLPRLTRGQMHRCVGSLDRRNGHFYCVSVRPVKHTELQTIAPFIEVSQAAIQEQLVNLKED
ncbi:spermatogenesis-associated protein 22 [Porites harrisoni]